MMAGTTALFLAASAILLQARAVMAHGHDMSKIVDGHATSLDPIVCRQDLRWEGEALTRTGLHIMDTYTATDACIWDHISDGNGARCMSFALSESLANCAADGQESMARPSTGAGNPPGHRGILYGTSS